MKFDFRKFIAEFCGTMFLVLLACGTAIFSRGDLVATALAFGVVIVGFAYAIGPISGCHVNPAVSFAMAINKRISWFEFIYYVIAQFLGAVAGAAILVLIYKTMGVNLGDITALGQNGFNALNGWGAGIVEFLLTFVFVLVIVAVTGKKSGEGVGKKAGLIIGLTLTLVHLIGIGLTGTSVNPARSFGPAIFLMGETIRQYYVFLLAPMLGAAAAAVFGKFVLKTE